MRINDKSVTECGSNCSCFRCSTENSLPPLTNHMLEKSQDLFERAFGLRNLTNQVDTLTTNTKILEENKLEQCLEISQIKEMTVEMRKDQLEQKLEIAKLTNLLKKKGKLNDTQQMVLDLTLEKQQAQNKLKYAQQYIMELEKKVRERKKLDESWKSAVEELMIEHHKKASQMMDEMKLLKRQNEGYKASAKQASETLKDDISKISALESELKLKNDQKRDLIQQKRAFEAQIRTLDAELKESKMDECPICFEPTSIERKWTAFLPCGHRTCSDCADKISALPRNTNGRKCPNCRENINCFLVLEGIYEG